MKNKVLPEEICKYVRDKHRMEAPQQHEEKGIELTVEFLQKIPLA